MGSFKLLCAADMHLNMHMWNTNKAIRFDSLFSFYSLLSIAEQIKCPLVLAGDNFDTKSISSELFMYTRAIRDAYPNVSIYYINGNHDSNDPSWFSLMSNTHHLNKQGTDIDGTIVCGLDYVLADDFEAALKEVYPYAHILITHQTYDCFFKSPIAINHQLLKDRGIVLSGDYHMRGYAEIPSSVEGQRPTSVVSIGSATRCSISENPTGDALFIDEDTHGLDILRTYLPGRVFLNVSDLITKDLQPEDIVRHIPSSPTVRADLKYCGVNYTRFIRIITEAAKAMSKPKPIYTSSLGPVFVARTKDELDYANTAVKELKYGFVLYSPHIAAPVEVEDSDVVPQARDTISAYLQKVVQDYPCDKATKSALMDFILADTPTFIETEAKRFGLENNV